MANALAGPAEIAQALRPFTDRPDEAAVFFDLDGTLAPIVERPDQARVPAHSRELLGRIADRYSLAGIVTGRRATEAREMVGRDDLVTIGNHGYEVLAAREEVPAPSPLLAGHATAAAEFIAQVGAKRLREAGLRVEDKGPILALHWRGAAAEADAERAAAEIGERARERGLGTHLGRKVLEIRPSVGIDKGIGLREALRRPGPAAALYAGDDHTDVDGFRALRELVAAGTLRAAVTVGVISAESPPEVASEADLSVPETEGFVAVLEALA